MPPSWYFGRKQEIGFIKALLWQMCSIPCEGAQGTSAQQILPSCKPPNSKTPDNPCHPKPPFSLFSVFVPFFSRADRPHVPYFPFFCCVYAVCSMPVVDLHVLRIPWIEHEENWDDWLCQDGFGHNPSTKLTCNEPLEDVRPLLCSALENMLQNPFEKLRLSCGFVSAKYSVPKCSLR